MNNYDFLFKYIIIGDPSVGKSCILMQFLENKFRFDSETTIGVEFGSKFVDVDDKRVKLQIWDTAGQEVFKSITRSYYRGSIGAILTYDITNRQSFLNLSKWVQQTKNYANDKLTILLFGNKNDLDKKRQVYQSEGIQFALNHRMLFLQGNSKDYQLTKQIFIKLSKEIIRKITNNQIDPNNQICGIKLGNYKAIGGETPERKWMCC